MLSPAFHGALSGEISLPITPFNPLRSGRTSVLTNTTRTICPGIAAMVFLSYIPSLANTGEVAVDCGILAQLT
jgi:hypothetical protein